MDTPRWLIKKGKGEEASKAAVYIRKWDEKLTPEREEQIVTVVQEAAKDEVYDRLKCRFLHYNHSFLCKRHLYLTDSLFNQFQLIKMGKGKKNYYFYHLFSDWKLGSYAIVFATSLYVFT